MNTKEPEALQSVDVYSKINNIKFDRKAYVDSFGRLIFAESIERAREAIGPGIGLTPVLSIHEVVPAPPVTLYQLEAR